MGMDAANATHLELPKGSTSLGVGRFIRRNLLNARGKNSFIESLNSNARVLDVGCGNNSPFYFKQLQPDAYYVGLDVGDHGQTTNPNEIADEYIVVPPDQFCDAIVRRPGDFDGIISAHNLEHCQDPYAVLTAMLRALGEDGRLYLSFPSEASVTFPKRGGCLNFYDDPTHDQVPDYSRVLSIIKSERFDVVFAAKQYRPILRAIIGAILEPVSRYQNAVKYGTWAFWGFETVIWARRAR